MDIQAQKIAQSYAKAFLNVTPNVLTIDSCRTIQHAVNHFKKYPEYTTVLKIPTISLEIKKKILATWFKSLQVSVDIARLLDVLANHQRLFLFATILEKLCREYYKRNNVIEFSIQATLPLEKEADIITAFLEKKINKHILSTFVLTEKLIAGIRLQSDTYLWEYSLRQRLNTIKNII